MSATGGTSSAASDAVARRARIDPRIRERRVAVRRELGQRRLRIVLAVLSGAALVAAAWLVVSSPLLDVDHIRIAGTEHVDPAVVRAAIGDRVKLGDPLLRVNGAAVERAVEAVPWIAEAHVRRAWPGTLQVRVTEEVPVAFVRRSDTAAALVSAGGRVLEDVRTPAAGLLEITGVRHVPAVGSTLFPAGAAGVRAALPDALAREVVGIDVGDGGVTLLLARGAQVRLGTVDDLAAKGAAAQAVVERLGNRPFDYVDVRVPSAPVAGTPG